MCNVCVSVKIYASIFVTLIHVDMCENRDKISLQWCTHGHESAQGAGAPLGQ